MLSGAHSLVGAVVHDACDLVVELGGNEIEGVLQRAGDRVVVLGRDEDEGVELFELRTPGLRVVVGVHLRAGGDHLVEQGQVEAAEVDDLGADIIIGSQLLLDPVHDLRVESLRAGGSGNDGDVEHMHPQFVERCPPAGRPWRSSSRGRACDLGMPNRLQLHTDQHD